MMLGNVAPGECETILRMAMAGRLAEAQTLQSRILEADWQILSRGAAGLKAALDLLAYDGGKPRAPSPACNASDIEQIRQAMRQAGFIR